MKKRRAKPSRARRYLMAEEIRQLQLLHGEIIVDCSAVRQRGDEVRELIAYLKAEQERLRLLIGKLARTIQRATEYQLKQKTRTSRDS